MQKQLLLISLLMCGAVNAAATSAAASKQSGEGQSEGEEKAAAALIKVDTSKLISKVAAQEKSDAKALEMLNNFITMHNAYVTLGQRIFGENANHRFTYSELDLCKAHVSFGGMTYDQQTLTEDRFKAIAAKAWRKKHGQATGPETAEEAHQN